MNHKLHKKYQEVFENHWWFLVREKILDDVLKKYVGSHSRILDFGCNYGHMVHLLQQKGYDALGADISEDAIQYGVSIGITNIYTLGNPSFKEYCPPQSCDVVLALDVVEHIKDDEEAIASMYSLLKPGGIMVIMVPAYMFLWGIQDEVAEHYRRYTMKSLFAKINTGVRNTAQPISVLRRTYFNTFLFLPIACIRLASRIFNISSRESDFDIHGPRMNKILFWIFNLERKFLKRMNFPFGVSILAVLKK